VFSTLHTNDARGGGHAADRPRRAALPDRRHRHRRAGAALVRTSAPPASSPTRGLDRADRRGGAAVAAKGEFRPCKPVGCLECRHTGFRGRGGLYELLGSTTRCRGPSTPTTTVPRCASAPRSRACSRCACRRDEGGAGPHDARRGAARHAALE
jgi:hypothetical protein